MIEKKLTAEIEPLATGRMLHGKELTLVEQVQAHRILNFMKGVIETRMEIIKGWLFDATQDGGDKDAKGTYKIVVEGSNVFRQRRVAKSPDEKKLQTLLKSKGLKTSDAFTEVKSWELDPSKVEKLVKSGKMTQEEIDKLCKETFALVIEDSPDLKEVLEVLKSGTSVGLLPEGK